MKAVGRPGLASNQRLSVGASLTIAALLGLFGTYRLVYRESADDDFLIDLGSATYLSSDGPRERPGKTERRTEAFNGDEKHRQYVKQIRDAEKEDKVGVPHPLQTLYLHTWRSAKCGILWLTAANPANPACNLLQLSCRASHIFTTL